MNEMEERIRTMLYKSSLDVWKFQIDSFWIRTSSFAVFELAFAAGLWKLFSEECFFTTLGMAVGGLLLTVIWIINNSRLHEYIVYYKERVEHYEELLGIAPDDSIFFGFKANGNQLRKRIPGSYHIYVQLMPVLFLLGWGWMLCWSTCELHRSLMIR